MMNERIRALVEQAGFDAVSMVAFDIKQDLEKFAELIVRECSGIAEGGWADPAHQIRQHFGVEE